MHFSEIFIRRPVATILLIVGLLMAGSAAFFQLPVAALPQADFPTISVSAQKSLVAGPMAGSVELRDAIIWLEVSPSVKQWKTTFEQSTPLASICAIHSAKAPRECTTTTHPRRFAMLNCASKAARCQAKISAALASSFGK